MAKRNVNPDTTVYSAAIWWRDCDPMFNVIATTAKACERVSLRSMRYEAHEAWSSDWEDGKSLSDFMDDICWSGVCPFALSDLASGRELEDAIRDLNNDGVCYLSQ